MAQKVFKPVFQITIQYTDFEMHESVVKSEYVKDIIGVVEYFKALEKEYVVLDAFRYACRSDLKVNIKSVFIPEKKYVSLFL